MKLRTFSYHLLHTASQIVPLIQTYISSQHGDLNAAFDSFMKYKLRVPVCGAILLNKQWNKVCFPSNAIMFSGTYLLRMLMGWSAGIVGERLQVTELDVP